MTTRYIPGLILALGLFAVSSAHADIQIDLGRGPVTIRVPASYDPATPAPLVLLLHGYGATGAIQEAYMRFRPLQEEFGFLFAAPDGTTDVIGNQFWNATDACCDLFGAGVDDSTYLADLIDAVKAQLNVDTRRVYLVGHSNGGFMAYRMACDHPDTIAAIASLAGATWQDPGACSPSSPVNVLQIHGTADTTIFFAGGCLPRGCYPGAVESVEDWATFDGCSLATDTTAPNLDLERSIPGAETTVTRYVSQCAPDGSGELWTIVGGAHVPNLTNSFSRRVIEYLYAHPKAGPCPADIDGDGDADVGDFFAFVSAFAAGDPAADVNDDGSIDVGDFFAFVSAFALGCA